MIEYIKQPKHKQFSYPVYNEEEGHMMKKRKKKKTVKNIAMSIFRGILPCRYD